MTLHHNDASLDSSIHYLDDSVSDRSFAGLRAMTMNEGLPYNMSALRREVDGARGGSADYTSPIFYPVPTRGGEGVKDCGRPLWKLLPGGSSNTRAWRTWSIDTRNGNGVTKGSHSSVSHSFKCSSLSLRPSRVFTCV